MRKFLLSLAIALAPTVALAQGYSGPMVPNTPPFIASAYPSVASDMNAARHLSNLVGKTTAVVCSIGDSTMTEGPVASNAVDPSQMTWSFLQTKMRGDNPQIAFTFTNFAIGATNENNVTQTGTTLAAAGIVLPSWFTVLGSTWLSYPQAASCDVLFYLFGTNTPTSGAASGSGAASFIKTNFAAINLWTKIPNIIIITNKIANPSTDTSGDDAAQYAHNAQAAFHRTFARSGGAGYTTFSSVSALGYGLVDLGRYFTVRTQGFDPDAQYMISQPSCVASKTLTNSAVIGTTTGTICTTTHGDYRATVVFPATGGVDLRTACPGSLRMSGGAWVGNYLRMDVSGAGVITPRWSPDGATSGDPTQLGIATATTAGQDTTLTVSMSSTLVRLWITNNGVTTLALDVQAPRFISGKTGGTPINLGCTATPGAATFNVTEFYQGVGTRTTPTMNYTQAFGTTTTCTPSDTACQGGNTINHQTGSSAELDREYINALDFRVPLPFPVDTRLTKTANYTVLFSDGGKQFDNLGAAGEVDFTLPVPTAGLRYGFCALAAQVVKLIAPAATTISIGASTSAAAGNVVADTIASCVQIEGTSATNYTALASTGVWTVN